ncbi:hypothetical protein ACHAXT_004314 [Thalassiosira profunda]
MSKAQDPDAAASDDDDSVAEDLKILSEMNIDEDFNVWGDFRNSFAVKGQRDSLASLISSRSSGVSSASKTSATPAVPGVQNKWEPHEKSITENDLIVDFGALEKEEDAPRDAEDDGEGATETAQDSAPIEQGDDRGESLDVSFSRLTPGEQRDIRAWNLRLSRDTVFSRYYFPRAMGASGDEDNREVPRAEESSRASWVSERAGDRKAQSRRSLTSSSREITIPKSVLLKRGPILFDGVEERELLLFTHGFLLSRIEFDTLLNILFTINSENPEFLSSMKVARALKEVFSGLGVPIGERALSDVMERFDSNHDGEIQYEEFEKVMQEMKPKPEAGDRWSLGSLGKKLTKTLQRATSAEERKLDCAFPLLDIERVESINICSSEATAMFASSSWAPLMFAIYIKGKKGGPLIMVCSKPEHREAWVDALKTCYVKSVQLKADSGFGAAKAIRSLVGVAAPDHSGFSVLFGAAALGHLECAKILLQKGAQVNVRDNEENTALDLASLAEHDALVELLEQHGAEKHTSKGVFESALEEQKLLKKGATQNKSR